MIRATARILALAIAVTNLVFVTPALSQESASQAETDVFDEQSGRGSKSQPKAGNELSSNAQQLAELLKVVEPIKLLKQRVPSKDQNVESLVQTILLRQKVQQSIQYAALELEEA